MVKVTICPFLAQLFQRCLMKVLHIDLWKCYLSYVRETKGKLPSYKYVIFRAVRADMLKKRKKKVHMLKSAKTKIRCLKIADGL